METEKSMRVLRLTTEEAETRSRVGDGDGDGDGEIFVSDIVDEAGAPDAKMTVGFARVARGEALDISFPYDEVIMADLSDGPAAVDRASVASSPATSAPVPSVGLGTVLRKWRESASGRLSDDARFDAGIRRAVLVNLLSIAAAWGLIVLVWQHGFGSEANWGIGRTG